MGWEWLGDEEWNSKIRFILSLVRLALTEPLNVITLGQSQTHFVNQMITILKSI
jgi:hypothetical protein